jgi:hypothetical protein
MFIVYACIFLGGSLTPLWPPFQGAFLVLGAFCAFFAGTMRTLDRTRPLWDRVEPDAERETASDSSD